MKYRYLKFSEHIRQRRGLAEYMKKNNELKYSSFSDSLADTIFTYIDGKTTYLKDRYGTNYQYTSEEMLVISLSAVLLDKVLT